MSKRKKSEDEEIEPSDVAVCTTCEPSVEFDMLTPAGRDALKEHLATVHGVDSKTMQGRLTMHLDGRTWYGSNYQYESAGVVVGRRERRPRAKDDMMRFD